MRFKQLSGIQTEVLLNTFNKAFEGYFVHLELTSDQLLSKIHTENIDLDLSVGAFRDDRLVGFVLHGKGKLDGLPTFYNAGTGVVASERGQGLTQNMYEFILPHLKQKGYQQGILEVICKNHGAVKVYEKTGYAITRKLNCYRGVFQNKSGKSGLSENFDIRRLEDFSWSAYERLWDWTPTWQNLPITLERFPEGLNALEAWRGKELLGYLIFQPKGNRVKQFAVHPKARRQGIIGTLFESAFGEKEMFAINVDADGQASNAFFEKAGLDHFLSQYEMKLTDF